MSELMIRSKARRATAEAGGGRASESKTQGGRAASAESCEAVR